MALSFRINPLQTKDWAEICGFDEALFKKVEFEVLSETLNSTRASKLFQNVERVAENKQFSEALCRQLISLSAYRRAKKIEPTDAVDALLRSFEAAPESEHISGWLNRHRDGIIKLLSSDNVRLSAKSLQLSTDHSALFISGNILTDLRPVFDGAREAIQGGVVVQTLRLHFYEDGNEKDVSIAMDSDDIDNLLVELNKAKTKAESTRKLFDKELGIEVFVTGEESYGFS